MNAENKMHTVKLKRNSFCEITCTLESQCRCLTLVNMTTSALWLLPVTVTAYSHKSHLLGNCIIYVMLQLQFLNLSLCLFLSPFVPSGIPGKKCGIIILTAEELSNCRVSTHTHTNLRVVGISSYCLHLH